MSVLSLVPTYADQWHVPPLDVAGGGDASGHRENASEIAFDDAKSDKRRDNWNRRKYGKAWHANALTTAPAYDGQSRKQSELSR